MNAQDNTYDKYIESDQFFYDENNNKKGAFLRQDLELYNEDDASVPGHSVRVKRISKPPKEDWLILVDNKEHLLLKGTRFTAPERTFLRSVDGTLFIINGAKSGWKSVSEFKRQLKDKLPK